MSTFKLFATFAVASIAASTLLAEPRCPGNATSLHSSSPDSSLIIIPITINHTGPYQFLLDTGAQVTVVDPALATKLKLKARGSANFSGVGFQTHATLDRVDQLAAGDKSADDVLVVEQDSSRFEDMGLHIQGVLGANFLGRFDVLIDYANSMVCLDGADTMRQRIKGERIPLQYLPQGENEIPSSAPLVIQVHLPEVETRPLLLKLDSGTNVVFLFDPDRCLAFGPQKGSRLSVQSADGNARAYTMLPSQKMKIGKQVLPRVQLVKFANKENAVQGNEVDGLLTTTLFRTVFISYAAHFVILAPR